MKKLVSAFRCFVPCFACLVLVSAVVNAEESESTRSVQIIGVPDEASAKLVDLTGRAENSSGLTLEILPSPELRIGSAMSIRISTQRSGYVILLDIDAEGKLTQVFPNRTTLVSSVKSADPPNTLSAGGTLTIPPAADPGLQMVVGPPKGIGMIVAVLSEQPVQLLDLPDVPAQLLGRVGALEFVTDAAHGLRLEPRGNNGRFMELKLSFAAKFYAVQ
jgi:Domain of unknown function (DUF4384)